MLGFMEWIAKFEIILKLQYSAQFQTFIRPLDYIAVIRTKGTCSRNLAIMLTNVKTL